MQHTVNYSKYKKRNDTLKPKTSNLGWIVGFGNVVIDPVIHYDLIFEWKIKASNRDTSVGIDASMRKFLSAYCFFGTNTSPYYAYANNGRIESNQQYNKSFSLQKQKANHIIKMQLNIPKRTLIFFNDDSKGYIASDKINTDYKYTMAVCTHGGGTAQIIDFSIKQATQ